MVGEKAILKLGKSYETRKATMALDSQFRTYAISGKTQKSDDQSLDNIAMTSKPETHVTNSSQETFVSLNGYTGANLELHTTDLFNREEIDIEHQTKIFI